MNSRLGSATVAAGFPRGKQPEFPIGENTLGQCSCEKYLIPPQIHLFVHAVVWQMLISHGGAT